MTFEDVVKEVSLYKEKYGDEICTDPVLSKDGTVATYTFMPGEASGYVQKYNLTDNTSSHCGLGTGCFWTEDEEA